MALTVWVRRILCFCTLCIISCDLVFAGSCLSVALTAGGDSASAVKGDNVFGCTANCSSPESQTHVIIRTRTINDDGTYMDVKNTCNFPVNLILVLLSDVPTKWTLYLSSLKRNITIQHVYVHMPNCTNNGSFLGVQGMCFNFSQRNMSTFDEGNITQTTSLIQLFQNITKTQVLSINKGNGLAIWNLPVGGQCCPDSSTTVLTPMTPLPTVSATSATPTKIEMATSEQMSVFPATGEDTIDSNEGPQTNYPSSVPTPTSFTATNSNGGRTEGIGDKKSADNLPIVIGLVVLSVVLLSLSIGFGCCIFCRKKKAALVRGSTQAEPNIYVESPNAPESNDNGVTRDEPAPDEVEYEEAATVIPPVRPPRNIQP